MAARFSFSRGSRGFTLPISRVERVAGGRLSGVAGVVNNKRGVQPCAGQPIWPSRLARLPVFWDPWLPWEERRRRDRVAQPSIISCVTTSQRTRDGRTLFLASPRDRGNRPVGDRGREREGWVIRSILNPFRFLARLDRLKNIYILFSFLSLSLSLLHDRYCCYCNNNNDDDDYRVMIVGRGGKNFGKFWKKNFWLRIRSRRKIEEEFDGYEGRFSCWEDDSVLKIFFLLFLCIEDYFEEYLEGKLLEVRRRGKAW